jgi:hypothetical protein
VVSRGEGHDRIEIAANAVTDLERLQVVDKAIADLETERSG